MLDLKYDLLKEGKWISLLSGFSMSEKRHYLAYRVFLFAVFFYMLLMEVLACVFKADKQLRVEAAHSILATVFGIWALATRVIAHRSVSNTTDLLKTGVFVYDNEEEDSELMKLKRTISKEIESKSNLFVTMNIMGALSNALIFPAFQILFLDPDTVKRTDVVNPYLPHIYYQPFDTTRGVGFWAGGVIGFLYFYVLYGVAVGANWVYLNCAVQLKVHLRVLNHSIKNIQKRACHLFSKRSGDPRRVAVGRMEESHNFDECLYSCLKSNIQHHQALLRLMKVCEPFCGSYLLDIFTLASMIFGTQLYLIHKVPPLNVMIILVASFIAEQFTAVYVCMLGEDVLIESEKVFERLYTLSWFNYSKRFNQILHIMMSNTLKPIGLRAMMFGVPASLQIYGDIVSAMYKISNLVRSSEVI